MNFNPQLQLLETSGQEITANSFRGLIMDLYHLIMPEN